MDAKTVSTYLSMCAHGALTHSIKRKKIRRNLRVKFVTEFMHCGVHFRKYEDALAVLCIIDTNIEKQGSMSPCRPRTKQLAQVRMVGRWLLHDNDS